MAKFTKTVDIWKLDSAARKRLQCGQWVTAGADGPKGRFYGEGRVTVVAWLGNAKASRDYVGYMKTLRKYAKTCCNGI